MEIKYSNSMHFSQVPNEKKESNKSVKKRNCECKNNDILGRSLKGSENNNTLDQNCNSNPVNN